MNEINIARHLEKFQKVLGETHIPTLALLACVSDVAAEIKRSLLAQEILSMYSISDAISTGNDIGCRADLEYNPNSSLYPAKIRLRKE